MNDIGTVRLFGIFDTPTKKNQAGVVWDTDYLAPTLCTSGGGYHMPLIIVKDEKHKDKECD